MKKYNFLISEVRGQKQKVESVEKAKVVCFIYLFMSSVAERKKEEFEGGN